MEKMLEELQEMVITIAFFLGEECGFTPEKQAHYKAQVQVMLEATRSDPTMAKEILDKTNKDFQVKVDEQKEKIVEGFKQ